MSKIKTVNPATGKTEKEFDIMSPEQVDKIIEKAHKAYLSWRNSSFETRKTLLNKVAKVFRDRKEELGKLATIEMGKLLAESIYEVELCAGIFEYYANNCADLLKDKPCKPKHGSAYVQYAPKGVILSVQPWNFPFYQITRSAAPIIASGDTIVLKHASNVPQCAKIVEDIFTECGSPEGVYSNLFIPGSQITRLVANPYIVGCSLTGSEPAGVSFASEAGKYIKPQLLELGGSDPCVILDDVDIDVAVNSAVMGRFWNCGQVCVSPKRIIVHAKIYDQFLAKVKAMLPKIVVGDGMDAKTQLSPCSSEASMLEVLEQVQQAVKQGATLAYGGKRIDRPGAYMEPTLLVDIPKNNVAYYDEIFGPVLGIYKVANDEEAITMANDTKFGLGASVFSKDVKRAEAIARRIDAGMVYINHITGIAPELQFGGTKASGYGRDQAEIGIYEFVNIKLIRTTTPDALY